jgi:phospholipid/cholesterol/gamma-HCH transport system permease protein
LIIPLRIVAGVGTVTLGLIDYILDFLRGLKRISALIFISFSRMHLIAKNISISIQQMYSIGIGSLPLISVIALFTGSVTVTQAVYQFSGIVPLRYLGLAVCKALITELGPVITSIVFACRVCTAIAAEVGSMKATEQLDAMTCLNLDPIRYIIVPKIIACIIMVPVLVIWAELLAFLGSIVTVILSVDTTLYLYLSGLRMFFNPADLFIGIVKTSVFGCIIAIVGSHFGLETTGGAEGVGIATTRAVMTSIVLILVFDFIIAFLVL